MAPNDRRNLVRYGVPIAAGGLPFLVYLRTMAPTVYGLDSAELTVGADVLGIVHSPGSPLFLLVSHVFTWLPFGDVGYRVNLVSVCAGAGAIAVLAALIRRLTGKAWVAIGGGWLLGFSYYYWVSALAAELYAPLALTIAMLLLLAEAWRRQRRSWQLCLFTFVFGLGLGNHMSLGAMLPGFAYLLFGDLVRPRRSVLAAAILCGLAGASVYLYLPLRAAAGVSFDCARDYGIDASTWSGFWFMLRGGMFRSLFLGVPVSRLPQQFVNFVFWLWSNFLGLGCLIGFVGMIDAPVRLHTLRRASILMLLGHVGFLMTYEVADKEFMLAPDYLIWGLWIALGAQPTADLVQEVFRGKAQLAGGVILTLLAATNLFVNYGLADISDDWSARSQAESIFRSIEPGATFIGSWIDVPVLQYLQMVEGERPDVELLNTFFARDGRSVAVAAEKMGRGVPVYTSSAELFSRYGFDNRYTPDCGCYRLTVDPLQCEWIASFVAVSQ